MTAEAANACLPSHFLRSTSPGNPSTFPQYRNAHGRGHTSGHVPGGPPPITLAEAHASWKERWRIGKAASTVERKDEAWPHMAVIEAIPLSMLTPAQLEDAIAGAARVAPRQAQLALETVKQVLRDAIKRGQRVDSALLEVKAPRYQEREPVFLTAAEVEDLASWCAEPRLIIFAALSGLRLGEVLALRDTDIDLEEGCLLVARAARKGVEGRTKTRKRRRVYLCAPALQAVRQQLLARRPNPLGLVFPSPRSDTVWNSDNFRADVFAKAIGRAAATAVPARRADIARLEFHDLRHTFASLMIAAGANPLQLAEALGHTDKNGRPDPTLVWKRYGHLYPGSTRAAAAALDPRKIPANRDGSDGTRTRDLRRDRPAF
jgi:integrase